MTLIKPIASRLGGGAVQVIALGFDHTDSNLDSGIEIYTPRVGDIVLDAWFQIDTAFASSYGAVGDFGQFESNSGWLAVFDGGSSGADVSVADRQVDWGGAPGSPWSQGSAFGPRNGLEAQNLLGYLLNSPTSFPRMLPLRFASDQPVLVCISQDGRNAAVAGAVQATNAATVPTTVLAATNDEFIVQVPGGAPSITYTVAPGTYGTIAALEAAMMAASGGSPLSNYIALSNDGTKLTATAAIPGKNSGVIFNTGTHDFLAASGFTDSQSTINGTGGASVLSAGSGSVLMHIARPR